MLRVPSTHTIPNGLQTWPPPSLGDNVFYMWECVIASLSMLSSKSFLVAEVTHIHQLLERPPSFRLDHLQLKSRFLHLFAVHCPPACNCIG